MEAGLSLLLFLVMGGAMAALGLHQLRFRNALAAAWRGAAQRVGLSPRKDSVTEESRSRAEARGDGLRVIFTYDVKSKRAGTRIRVEGLDHGNEPLSIRREGLAGWFSKQFGEGDIEIGASVDSDLVIQGDEVLAQALLDRETREMLSDFLKGRLGSASSWAGEVDTSCSRGTLEVWVRHVRGSDEESLTKELAEVLAPLVDLARRLRRPEDLALRLAERIAPGPHWEPEDGARLKCLRLLVREFRAHAATARAIEDGVRDESEWVRLEAALALGREGVATLQALIAAPTTGDGCAARALTAVASTLSPEEVAATLSQALIAHRIELSLACLEALAHCGPEAAEKPLLAALQSSSNDAVRTAAARGLGRAGTVEAVLSLLAAEASGPRAVASAARQAVAEIQSRLTGAEQGQISLSESEAGALSLASENAAGRLSVIGREEEAGDEGNGPLRPTSSVSA